MHAASDCATQLVQIINGVGPFCEASNYSNLTLNEAQPPICPADKLISRTAALNAV
jgi:hypothetical protein